MSQVVNDVHRADKAITANADALRCVGPLGNEDHGKMFPHGSGDGLVCGKCGATAPMTFAEVVISA